MIGLASRADLRTVNSAGDDSSDRGAAIRRRFEDLGISDREWHLVTGIDRKTLNRAMRNESRRSTYTAIESWLDKLESRSAGRPTDIRIVGDPADDLVEFTVEGNFGVRAVVKGPVRDIEVLRSAVADLIADMNRPPEGRD